MKCHPDLFPEKAQDFKNLQDAYERLMNWDKEKPHFDRTEHTKKKGSGSQERLEFFEKKQLFLQIAQKFKENTVPTHFCFIFTAQKQ